MNKTILSILLILNLFSQAQAGGIVSLLPSLTDIIVDLGCEDRLTGITSFCIVSDKCKAEKLGGVLDTNIERILRLSPDMVMAHTTSKSRLKILEQAGIHIEYLRIDSIDEVISAYHRIGEILNKNELAVIKTEKISQLLSQSDNSRNKSINGFIVMNARSINTDNILTVDRKNYYSEIMEKCGITNCVKTQISYPSYNSEELLKINPDIIFIITDIPLKNRLCDQESLKPLKACRDNMVFTIMDEKVLHPGPSVFTIFKQMKKGLESYAANQ